jgi:hypothetical protein
VDPALQTQPPTVTEDDVKKRLTAVEWQSVSRHDNQAKRVRELMKAAGLRLLNARQQTAREAFAEATTLVEDYIAIISYAFTSIDGIPAKDRKRRQNACKEFDLAVRRQLQVLRDLRHEFPVGNTRAEDAFQLAERLRIMALNRFSGAPIIGVPEGRP